VSDRVDDYDYEFPAEAIAHEPAARREDARLLVIDREGDGLRDARITDFTDELRAGDLLVVNDTRVMPAKLAATRTSSGGRVSVLVLHARADGATVLLGTRGTLAEGETLDVAGDTWRIARSLGEGRFEIEVAAGREVPTLMSDVGRMPLPPYIRRDPQADERDALDRERYQTTFSSDGDAAAVAIAAPTAGLHFTPELLAAIEARGVVVERLRLDVGEATFRPLRGESLDEHVMPSEHYAIPQALADRFAATRAAGGRVIAVGTTVVRSLESAVAADGRTLAVGPASSELFIRPGHAFRAVDALLTNFHQPRTSLLVLVSAFAGRDRILAAYAHALAEGYRFFSYGDATFIR
jgi:S-adenosylmethionine:tRNA ribosyltransferase-isomerase